MPMEKRYSWTAPVRPRHMAAARFASGTGAGCFRLKTNCASAVCHTGPTCCLNHAGPLQAALSFQLLHGISAQPGGDGHTRPMVVLLVQKSNSFFMESLSSRSRATSASNSSWFWRFNSSSLVSRTRMLQRRLFLYLAQCSLRRCFGQAQEHS